MYDSSDSSDRSDISYRSDCSDISYSSDISDISDSTDCSDICDSSDSSGSSKKNSAQDQSPPQELEVGPRSGPNLLVTVMTVVPVTAVVIYIQGVSEKTTFSPTNSGTKGCFFRDALYI